ncbi:TetR/AcrR family transcriptional regulator [Rhodohalobacter sp. SW132]|uniref:TetR/AcrR family transcriptional regulator n=1 Tax=Rhodohalobacter sp. SW132 TaxID=2293433 RepID=UPI000E25AE56|nr:TetR/AcrR family transcriptional regulator [Rhodohalobacter sp. SW132]REL33412.1 TetR/AcrR family transcriptional regulator [Rhodohalobacter sp. SW132]
MSLRDDILTVSRTLLIKEGFGKMSMRKIAGEVDVSATSIYLHFKNKDELILALIETSIGRLANVLQQQLEDGDDPIRKLEKMADGFIYFALNHPQEYEIIYMVRPEEMPRFPKEKFEQIRKIYELLADIIKEGKERGILHVDDPLMSAYTVWAQLHGVASVVISKRLDTRIPTDTFIKQAVDHIIQGFISQKTTV